MSFILDSLEKADQERQRGKVPDLQTRHGDPPPPRRRRLWPYLLLVVLLVNAGLLAWQLGPWHGAASSARPAAAAAVSAHPSPSPTQRAVVTAPLKKPAPSVAASVPDPPQETAPERAPSQKLAEAPTPPAASSPAPKKRAPSPETATPHPSPAEPAAAPPAETSPAAPKSAQGGNAQMLTVKKVGELPSSVRQGLPKLSMSLHYYTAAPASRLVRINGENLREGQSVTDGLTLERITPDGVVFDWRGTRFRVRKWTSGSWK